MVECQLPKLNVAGSNPVIRFLVRAGKTANKLLGGIFYGWHWGGIRSDRNRVGCSLPPPEPLHRLPQHRAQAHKSSLSQQALADLEAIAGVDRRERRREVLDRIARRGPLHPALAWDQTSEDLIRADRER